MCARIQFKTRIIDAIGWMEIRWCVLWSMTFTQGGYLRSELVLLIRFSSLLFCRGISSTVRRCIEKETGREFAAKIIDLGADSGDASSSQMLEATRQEIAILRQVMGHPYISEYRVCPSAPHVDKHLKIHTFRVLFPKHFSRTARRFRVGCIHIFSVWTVPKWRTIRLFDIGGDAVGEKDPIHYATSVRRCRLHTFEFDRT